MFWITYFSKAKLLLRKKKYQTEQLGRTEAALDTVEKLIQDLEYTQIEAKVYIINTIIIIFYSIMKQLCIGCWRS